jgi:hypothetical protein
MNWIKTSDSLPSDGLECVVRINCDGRPYPIRYHTGYYNWSGKYWRLDDDSWNLVDGDEGYDRPNVFNMYVTHWAEIIEPT